MYLKVNKHFSPANPPGMRGLPSAGAGPDLRLAEIFLNPPLTRETLYMIFGKACSLWVMAGVPGRNKCGD
jgi:hypothetical protein